MTIFRRKLSKGNPEWGSVQIPLFRTFTKLCTTRYNCSKILRLKKFLGPLLVHLFERPQYRSDRISSNLFHDGGSDMTPLGEMGAGFPLPLSGPLHTFRRSSQGGSLDQNLLRGGSLDHFRPRRARKSAPKAPF